MDNKTGKRDRTAKMLLAFLKDVAADALDITEAFLLSAGSTRRLVKNLGVIDREYYSSMQSLQRNGYVRKVNENQFLITPKGISKAQRLAKELVVFEKSKWDGKWYFVIFDVPDSKENQRNLFRATLKRMGFVGLQKSVFIAPFANFQKVAVIRDELGIAEYVTFFEGRASSEDDDDKLRKKFGLT